jgi:hypothetical protein
MTDDKRDVPGGGRRKPPTIDLKATEIASETVKPTEPSDSPAENPPSEAASETVAATESVAATTESALPAGGGGPEGIDLPQATTGRMDWRAFGAAAAGAGVMLVVFAVILATDVLTPRDTTSAPRLARLESQLLEIARRPQPQTADPGALADLSMRVAAAEQVMARLADLDARLGKAEQALARVGEFEQRLARVESRSNAPAGTALAPADSALADRVAALEAVVRPLADLGARLEALNAASRDAKGRADAAFDAAEKNAARGEIETLGARVAALEQAARAAQERIASTAGADRAGRLAFVAVSLRGAVERGEPFARELAAVKPLASDATLMTALEPFAATGVPRSAALARELSQLSGTMLSATGAPPREGGFLDRLQQNAERLVRIRPINEAPGDDAATVVTRADVKAANGDIAGALAEVKSLPPAASAPAQAWIRKAEAQVAALAAARSLADGAVGALAQP